MAGRPPKIAMTIPMTKEANRPTCGSMPATKEKAMTSGINAKREARRDANPRRCKSGAMGRMGDGEGIAAAAPPPPSPRTWSGVHSAARGKAGGANAPPRPSGPRTKSGVTKCAGRRK
ncbi:hypothetical protein WR25_12583 [Diploscapter pachys]|uniref:Uncharacterized protein n=1 Tax=Diploscapter pachys TaxID=2018661 RepID=A0A2A2M2I6_9BILA|nr:hypothetical protein WR25_12583 [Diploscapter pachys]